VRRTSLAEMDCSVARTLDVVGEWWTLLIIRDAFLGARHFEEFQRRTGIARNILAERLERLVENGVFERRPYQERPLRHEYRLTEKGRELFGVLTALRQWGDRWAAEGDPPMVLEHRDCGYVAVGVLTCSECGEPLTPYNVRAKGRLITRPAPRPGSDPMSRPA